MIAADVPSPGSSPRGGGAVRLAILDDNPFVRDPDGRIRPKAATFHRFAETVVAVGGLPAAAYLVPVADPAPGDPIPPLRPVDGDCLRVVPTTPFRGIGGYLRHAPGMTRRNWPLIRDTIAGADLVWIKAPASNALLAAMAARRAGVPRFTWVAGSVREVARGGERSPAARLAGGAIGLAYDGATRFLERTGPSIRLGADLFTSIIEAGDVETTRAALDERARRGDADGPLVLAWAGRMTAEKGVDDLVDALRRLVTDGRDVHLSLVGDGPARSSVAAAVEVMGLGQRVTWHGYVADRAAYLSILRAADMFVLPSHAEGVPKVVVEAMAAGLPVIATATGNTPEVLAHGRRGVIVPIGDAVALAEAIARLAEDREARARLRVAGLDYAADHTAEAQARRLLDWLAAEFPTLPWSSR